MKGVKEFTARSLDEAIEAACKYYDVPREKLEIDILNDAKSGIFGLVGVKKAKILAKQASVSNYADLSGCDKVEQKSQNSRPREETSSKQPHGPRPARHKKQEPSKQNASRPAFSETEERLEQVTGTTNPEATVSPDSPKDATQSARSGREHANPSNNSKHPRGRSSAKHDSKSKESSKPQKKCGQDNRSQDRLTHTQPDQVKDLEVELPIKQKHHENQEQLDSTELATDFATQGTNLRGLSDTDKEESLNLAKEALQQLLKPICPEAEIAVAIENARIEASINCEDASGLIIGREGQTLSALQYMVSRIISHKLAVTVHVHLDTGDYKERQDQKLKDISLRLATRARESGRTQYTKPLSSYHRRIVHMTLQAETDIETRSKGEGAMKRVYIFTRQKNQNG